MAGERDGERDGGWDIVSSSDDDDDEGLPCIRSYSKTDLRRAVTNNDFGSDWPEEILRQWERSTFGGAASFRYQQELNAMNVRLDGIRNDLTQALGTTNKNHQPSEMNQVSEYSVNDTMYRTKQMQCDCINYG